MRIAVFPGSFDPVTIGHQDIIARASKLFDRVYVSIVPNGTKTHPMFTDEQKLALMRASVEEFPNVEAELGGGLLTDYALRKNAQFLVRGARNSVDFDAERPHIDARIVCTIRIGQIVAVALIFGVGYLKQKLQAKKARAARAKTAPDTQERKVSNG